MDDTELSKILYQAQVNEAATVRVAELKASPGESLRDPGIILVYILFVLGLIVTFWHDKLAKKFLHVDLDGLP